MTAMPAPREPGLWLRVVSEPWEEDTIPCPHCDDGYHHIECSSLRYECPICKGKRVVTGTRRVRLVGWVEVGNWFNTGEVHIPAWKDDGPYIPHKAFEDEQSAIVGITVAYRAGTLPDEVAKWLDTEEVRDE